MWLLARKAHTILGFDFKVSMELSQKDASINTLKYNIKYQLTKKKCKQNLCILGVSGTGNYSQVYSQVYWCWGSKMAWCSNWVSKMGWVGIFGSRFQVEKGVLWGFWGWTYLPVTKYIHTFLIWPKSIYCIWTIYISILLITFCDSRYTLIGYMTFICIW